MPAAQSDLVIGVDIGSTTVKAVVINRHSYEILWSDYQRHHTKQPEKCLELLEATGADDATQLEQVLSVEHPQGQIHLAGKGLIGAPGNGKLRGEGLPGIDRVGEPRQLERLVQAAQILDPVQSLLAADNALILQRLE